MPAVPVLRGVPLAGLLPRLRRDVLPVLREASALGDLVRLDVPGRRRVYLVSDPGLVRRVLQGSEREFLRTPFHDKLKPVLGEGLVTSEGDRWRRQRKLIQPAFQPGRIRALVPLTAAAALELAGRWRGRADPGAAIDLDAEMSALALTVIERAMFGGEGRHGGIAEAIMAVQEHLAARFWALFDWTEALPTPGNRRFRRALATLDAAVAEVVGRRRRAGEAGDDLLGMLLSAGDEGGGMAPTQVRDEVMTMFLAGHETSAAGLTWAWTLLARHPEAAARLRDEAGAVLGGRPPAWDEAERLGFARMVVQETLRLYPPVPWFGRKAAADVEIGGHGVAAGSLLLVSPHTLHRDPRFWDAPEAFRPERFDPGRGGATWAYLPFGGGPRTCIGNRFAAVEMVTALAVLAPLFDVEPVARGPVPGRALVTLRPAGGLLARVAPRPPVP